MLQKYAVILMFASIVCGTSAENVLEDSDKKVNDNDVAMNLLQDMESLHWQNKYFRLRIELSDAKVEEEFAYLQETLLEIKDSIKLIDTKINQEIVNLKNTLLEMKELMANVQPTNVTCGESNEKERKDTATYPSSCAEALQNGNQSGIYKLHLPDSGLQPFEVYCLTDPEGGQAWTIVQRRQDGSTNFYRGWTEYKNGFGNVSNEYFIGLEKLHALTTKEEPQELWILMRDFEGGESFAKYDAFAIGSEDSQYALNVLGRFKGDTGDSLSQHLGIEFSTKDRDNAKRSEINCAVKYTGAWWFHDCCHSHLNGGYGSDEYKNGILWWTWDSIYAIKYVHMAIRPKQYIA